MWTLRGLAKRRTRHHSGGHAITTIIAFAAAQAFCSLFASEAWAGQYVVTAASYSGGSGTSAPWQGPSWYNPAAYRFNPNNGTYGGGTTTHGGGSFVRCEGIITVVLTWQPNHPGEPLPKSVIVYEASGASYGAEIYGAGADTNPGACNSGMTPQQGTESSSSPIYAVGPDGTSVVAGRSWGGSVTASKYSVKTGAATITLTCTPTANAANPGGPNTMARTWYKAEAHPVEIGLQGTIQDAGGGATVLIGQQLQAALVGGGASFTNHSWSVPSGMPFASWSISADVSSSTINWVDPSEWSKPYPSWYFAKPEQVTVSCSAVATGSDGTNIGTVTAEKPLPVRGPSLKRFVTTANDPFFTPGFTGIDTNDGGGKQGMAIDAGLMTPQPFSNQQGSGKAQFVQLINDVTIVDVFGISIPVTDTNGAYWLDNKYPYSEGLPGREGSSNENGSVQFDDSPYQGITDSTTGVTIADDFKCYLMYQPPQALLSMAVQWVPIRLQNWSLDIGTSRPGPAPNQNWSNNPPGYTTKGSISDSYGDWPIWSNRYENGNSNP